jgi:hypothetical protein
MKIQLLSYMHNNLTGKQDIQVDNVLGKANVDILKV